MTRYALISSDQWYNPHGFNAPGRPAEWNGPAGVTVEAGVMIDLRDRVAARLQALGHQVLTVGNRTPSDDYAGHPAIVNAWGPDRAVNFHSNTGHGSCVLVYGPQDAAEPVNINMANALADINPWGGKRTPVQRGDSLWEIAQVTAPVTYLEAFSHEFADESQWGQEHLDLLADTIASVLTGQAVTGAPAAPAPVPHQTVGSTKYQVSYLDDGLNRIYPGEVTGAGPDGGEPYAGVMGQIIDQLAIAGTTYRVHTEEDGWLPAVTGYDWGDDNNGYAGVSNHWIDAVAVFGKTYRVHTRESGWLPWVSVCDLADPTNGYAGILGQFIDAVQVQ